MSFQNAITDAIKTFLTTVHQIDDPNVPVTIPKQTGHGDFTTNAAMIHAKRIGKSPRDIAQQLVDEVKWPAELEKAEIAGPGFINFFVNADAQFQILKDIHNQGLTFGTNTTGVGQRVNVEFVSANPTGPLTVGHARNAVLGDTYSRILEANGYQVDREYYFNNAGRQMRMLGYSVYYRYMQLIDPNTRFDGDLYQGDYIIDIAQTLYDEYGNALAGDPDQDIFKKTAEAEIFADIKQSLERIGIVHDSFFNEQDLYDDGRIDALLKTFAERGLSYDNDGAVWLKTTDMGFEQDKVIVKSSGEPTYRLPDMAYHLDKFNRGYDRIIDIFGADHIDTYPDVLAAVKELGCDTDKVTVIIYQFVTLMRNNEIVKMSTRKANYVTLDELVEDVGADVVRYFINMRSVNTHLNFDLDLAKQQSDENPVFYLQYAHARICSILRRADERALSASDAYLSRLTVSDETDLMKRLREYPILIKKLADTLEQQKLCQYLYDLAGDYHRFNQTCRVVDPDAVELSSARLYLIESVRQVLANGLAILGVSAPEQM